MSKELLIIIQWSMAEQHEASLLRNESVGTYSNWVQKIIIAIIYFYIIHSEITVKIYLCTIYKNGER